MSEPTAPFTADSALFDVLRDRNGARVLRGRAPSIVESTLLHTYHGQPIGLVLETESGLSEEDRSLPTPQVTGTINLSASAGKVALTNTQTLLTGSNPIGGAAVVDFVGFGTANAYEGAGAAPTLSNTTAGFRAGSGATDTDSNSADFTSATPNPRNN